MTDIAGVAPGNMAYVMTLAGGGMVVGNLAGGYLTDRLGAARVSIILLFAMMIALIGVFFFSSSQAVSMVLTFVCGGLSMSIASPVNIMMMRAAPNAEMMAAAFMQAAFNVANALGAFLGGIPLEFGLPYNYPSLIGFGMTLTGLMIAMAYARRYGRVKMAPVMEESAGG